MEHPLLSVGIISFNRLLYLKATLESARQCIKYPNIQWIVIDGNSKEPGLQDYLKSKIWIDELHILDCTHVEAMNKIVELSKGDFILIWPDDVQFIVEGDWMQDVLEIMQKNPFLTSVAFSPLRIPTIKAYFTLKMLKKWKLFVKDVLKFGLRFRKPKILTSSRGFKIITFGWKISGIIGSGIAALQRKDTILSLGKWKSAGKSDESRLVDSSLGGEEYMLMLWEKSKLKTQIGHTVLPVAADIINDEVGSKAKVRSGKRYGNYTPPVTGNYFYEIYSQDKVYSKSKKKKLISFEEFVKPNGFDLPLDENGYLKKISINENIINDI